MINSSKFDVFTDKKALSYAKKFAGKKFSKNLEAVLTVGIRKPSHLPKLGFGNKKKIKLEEYVKKWVNA